MTGGGVWGGSAPTCPVLHPGRGKEKANPGGKQPQRAMAWGGDDTGTTHRDRPTPGWASTATTPVGRCRQTDPWQGHTGTLGGGGTHRGAPQGSGSVLSAPGVPTKTQSGAGVPQVCSEHTPPHATCPPHGGLQLLLPPPQCRCPGWQPGGGHKQGPHSPGCWLRPARAENFLPSGPRGQQGCVGGAPPCLVPLGVGTHPAAPSPFLQPTPCNTEGPGARAPPRLFRMQREAPTPAHPPHKTGPTPHPPPT